VVKFRDGAGSGLDRDRRRELALFDLSLDLGFGAFDLIE
jgi:hypothetical protein